MSTKRPATTGEVSPHWLLLAFPIKGFVYRGLGNDKAKTVKNFLSIVPLQASIQLVAPGKPASVFRFLPEAALRWSPVDAKGPEFCAQRAHNLWTDFHRTEKMLIYNA